MYSPCAHPFTCTCPSPQSHSPTIKACVWCLHVSHAGRREYSVSIVSSCRDTWGGCLRVMQVPAHSTTARRLPCVCDGTGGGNPPPGLVRRPPDTVPSVRRVGRLQGFRAEDAGERPRRGRAQRNRVDETISGPASGHLRHAQPPAPDEPAPSAPPNWTTHTP